MRSAANANVPPISRGLSLREQVREARRGNPAGLLRPCAPARNDSLFFKGRWLGEGRTKLVAEAPGARRAGGQFCDEVGLDAPSIAVAPDRAEVGREIGREYDFGEERVRDSRAQRLAAGQAELLEMAVELGFEAALEGEARGGVEGVAGVFGEGRAGGEVAGDQAIVERKERVGEPVQWQRALASVGQLRGRGEGAAGERDVAGELGTVAVARLRGAEFKGVAGRRDVPRAGLGDGKFGVGRAHDFADTDDPAAAVAEHEGALRMEVGVAKRFGQALAVVRRRIRLGPLRAGEKGAEAGVAHLPDVAAPAIACTLPRLFRGVGGVEQINGERGIGEAQHRGGVRWDGGEEKVTRCEIGFSAGRKRIDSAAELPRGGRPHGESPASGLLPPDRSGSS